MKIDLQYVNNSEGKTESVQLSLSDWEKLVAKIKKYETILKVKVDLTEAFEEVARLRKSKAKKQTLSNFLNEL